MSATDEYPGLTERAREIAVELKAKLAGTELGFTAFLFHLGEGGGIAYVSSAQRVDMYSAIVEWLRKQADEGHQAEILAAFERWFHDGDDR